MAAWYSQALTYSDYPRRAMERLAPKLAGIRSILDVGAGVGALAIPLTRMGIRVTALEPCPAMIGFLEKRAKRQGVGNMKIVEAPWGAASLPPHDAILVASVPHVLEDLKKFLAEADRIARRAVFLIQGVRLEQDKFLLDELYPLLFGREHPKKGDYLDTYVALHRMGIWADVEIFDYRFDQRFEDLEEAVDFWKEHMQLETDGYDAALKDFLIGRLKVSKGSHLLEIRKRSALIWWRL